MNHLLRTVHTLKSEDISASWYFKNSDGVTSAPVDINTLREMAANRDISATTEISRDGNTWVQASAIPDLEMDWIVLLPSGEYSSLHTYAAIENMRNNGAIPVGTHFFKRHMSPEEGSEGMRLVQQTSAALAQSRQADIEIRKLKADLEAKDLEFDSERQQLAATASKAKAEVLRRDAELTSAHEMLAQLNTQLEEKQTIEARMIDMERSMNELSSGLDSEKSKYEQEIEKLRNDVQSLKTQLEAAVKAAHDSESAAASAEQNIREFYEKRDSRITGVLAEIGKILLENPETSSPSSRTKTAVAAPIRAIRREKPVAVSNATIVEPEIISNSDIDMDSSPNVVAQKKLVSLEAQAQQEIVSLGAGEKKGLFWATRRQTSH